VQNLPTYAFLQGRFFLTYTTLHTNYHLLVGYPRRISFSIYKSTPFFQHFYIQVFSSYLRLLEYGFRTKPNLCLFANSRCRNSPILEHFISTPQRTRSSSTRTLRSSDILNRMRNRSWYITPDWASCNLPFRTTVGYLATYTYRFKLLGSSTGSIVFWQWDFGVVIKASATGNRFTALSKEEETLCWWNPLCCHYRLRCTLWPWRNHGRPHC